MDAVCWNYTSSVLELYIQCAGYIDVVRWIYMSGKPPSQPSDSGALEKITIVSILNKTIMEHISETNVRFCGCCHRMLSIDLFYINKRTHLPDNYCKECRREFSNARYRCSQLVDEPPRYPVITEVTDYSLRMALILHALQVVRQSVLGKRKRLTHNS